MAAVVRGLPMRPAQLLLPFLLVIAVHGRRHPDEFLAGELGVVVEQSVGDNSELCDVLGYDSRYSEVVGNGARVASYNGCPNHFSGCQKQQCHYYLETLAVNVNQSAIMPSHPVLAHPNDQIDLICSKGPVGVALNGVSLFGQSDGITDGECGSAVNLQGDTFNLCSGHAQKYERGGLFHYHMLPACLLDQLSDTDDGGVHSPQVGWAFDGLPVYGPRGPDGITMKPCGSQGADATYCLDDCNGYEGHIEGVDDFLYRYYMTGPHGDLQCSDTVKNTDSGVCQEGGDNDCCVNIVPPEQFSPFFIGCYRGCLAPDTACQENAQGPAYTASYKPEAAASASETVYIAPGVAFLY